MTGSSKGLRAVWSALRKEEIRVAVSQACGKLESEAWGWDQRSPAGAGRGSLSPAEHQEAHSQQQQESECAARPPPQAPRGHRANAAGRQTPGFPLQQHSAARQSLGRVGRGRTRVTRATVLRPAPPAGAHWLRSEATPPRPGLAQTRDPAAAKGETRPGRAGRGRRGAGRGRRGRGGLSSSPNVLGFSRVP